MPNGIQAAYYAMIELIDDNVGRMLECLERSGQRENTIVIFMSDHGEMLGDHGLLLKGCRFYEGLARVPLIISWPGRFLEGARRSALVELLDIAPTLLEMAACRFRRACRASHCVAFSPTRAPQIIIETRCAANITERSTRP